MSGNCAPGRQVAREYWDTCLFIAFLQNRADERELVDIVAARLKKAEEGENLIVVSTLVLAEIRPRSAYDTERAEVIRDLFYTKRPFILMVALSPRIADVASLIGADHNALTAPDAVHVATAWSERVDVLLTNDGKADRERRRSGELLFYDRRIGNPSLRIERPTAQIE